MTQQKNTYRLGGAPNTPYATRGEVDIRERLPAAVVGQSIMLQFDDDDPRSGFVDVEVLEI